MTRWMLLAGALATACMIPALAGDAEEADPGPWVAPPEMREAANPVSPSTESRARGRTSYEANCLSCHGISGDGKGPVALRLGFSAGDLRNQFVMSRQTDGELFWKITSGRDPMPAFKKKEGGLTDPEIWDLVNYVRTLSGPLPETEPE